MRYPFSVKPDFKVSVDTLNQIQRDTTRALSSTLTKGLAAGPFEPRQVGHVVAAGRSVERAISIFRAAYLDRPAQELAA